MYPAVSFNRLSVSKDLPEECSDATASFRLLEFWERKQRHVSVHVQAVNSFSPAAFGTPVHCSQSCCS